VRRHQQMWRRRTVTLGGLAGRVTEGSSLQRAKALQMGPVTKTHFPFAMVV